MNQTFSTKRFCRYFKYEVSCNARTFLLSFCAVLGLMLVPVVYGAFFSQYNARIYMGLDQFLRYDNSIDPMKYTMETVLTVGYFFATALAASVMFGVLSKKEGRISALMIPASCFEKYLTRFIIYILGALVAYLCAFEIADLIRCGLILWQYPDTELCHLYNIFDMTKNEYYWGALLFLQSLFALGAIVWPKHSPIKTLITLFVICLVLFMVGAGISSWLAEPDMSYGGNRTGEIIEKLFLWSEIAVTIACYVIAYFRFKEIEIIQRW